ncbi:hypothetical protein FISHEDRAFT_73530 [Fistulina hepatica ATCC 64428]|uniref:ATP synthase complex subunit H n=1 Tax=Fistulina hepatica ATCC 64428 TaxID=1128425 RepID=A0A0D7AC41_9AGAR|nr:hypothetical protein FISHEDRAFT_73530 [Fistulina hepatica ATCC 64428]
MFRQASSSVARAATRSRLFSSSVVARKDFVQDLYIKELKTYKPVSLAKDDHVGNVKPFSKPPVPKAPVLPDVAAELSAYDASEPTLASVKSTPEEADEDAAGAQEFLEMLEADLPPREVHHH